MVFILICGQKEKAVSIGKYCSKGQNAEAVQKKAIFVSDAIVDKKCMVFDHFH